jgi:hypothetical protein
MKKDKKRTVSKKFDLQKMKVAKLDDLTLINGGNSAVGNLNTITDTLQNTVITD